MINRAAAGARWLREVAMAPPKLSEAIELVARVKQRGRRRPHWYDSPVGDLIAVIGDLRIDRVEPAHILDWYDALRNRPNQRRPEQPLSAWTVDSYGRAIRAFFNSLVEMGHLDASPARHLVLPRLPAKRKKEIAPEDIDRMIRAAEYNARDHAMILVLRDSGVRVGELVDMIAGGLKCERDAGGRYFGRILITDQKTHSSRFAFIGHDACEALHRYLRSRPFDAPDWLWLSHRSTKALTGSGVYQALERLAKRAGVADHWNPHAFRHALAKRLVEKGAPLKVIQGILGHQDVSTTLNMYVTFDDQELADYHRRFTEGK